MTSENFPVPKIDDRWLRRIGTSVFLALFFGVGLWLNYTQLSGAIIVNGAVDVIGEAKSVQHREGGDVAAIFVTPGQTVSESDTLIELDVSEKKIQASLIATRIRATGAKLLRLHAERNGQDRLADVELLALDDELQPYEKAILHEKELLKIRNKNMSRKKMRGEHEIAEMQIQMASIQVQINAQTEQRTLLSEEMAAQETLLKSGHTSLAKTRRVRHQISVIEGELGKLQGNLSVYENNISQTKIKMDQQIIAFRESVLSEFLVADAELNDLLQRLSAINNSISRAKIKAPISGIVHKLAIFTVGGVVKSSEELMQIVPQNTALEIEAPLDTRYIDDISENRSVLVRFSGLDLRTAPELSGTIKSVSPSTILDPTTGAAFYQIKIKVELSELNRLTIAKPMPGMPVEVFIKTTNRTALAYLTDPITEQFARAFRE